MSVKLPCVELCPDGEVAVVGPYVPNPLITEYQVYQFPRSLIDLCPSLIGPCALWWFYRIHGFDVLLENPEDPSPQLRLDFPEDPYSTLKVEIRWYEYKESMKSAKGPTQMRGRLAFQPMNQSGGVWNKIVADIGTGLNLTIPPTGKVEMRILVPDLDAYVAGGGIFPAEGPTTEQVGWTRITPSAFVTDSTLGHNVATYTQSVYLEALQTSVTLEIPPLAQHLTVLREVIGVGADPTVEFLWLDEATVLGAATVNTTNDFLNGLRIPQNAKFLRITSNGYVGIATIIFALEL